MPSLAVTVKEMALATALEQHPVPGISTGNLATDPWTHSQTEVSSSMARYAAGKCGGTCARWGDYSAMSLDPDGCTFWYTNEYYATTGLNDSRGSGLQVLRHSCRQRTVQGTVHGHVAALRISGATIKSSRSTTTNGSGFTSS